jgi:hypothetical protein
METKDLSSDEEPDTKWSLEIARERLARVKRIHTLIQFLAGGEKLKQEQKLIGELAWFLLCGVTAPDVPNQYIARVDNIVKSVEHPNPDKQDQIIIHVILDAVLCDKLGPMGIAHEMCKTTSSQQAIDKLAQLVESSKFYTASGAKVGTPRLTYTKHYLKLFDLQVESCDFAPRCEICDAASDEFIRACKHSFCDKCAVVQWNTLHCTICDKTVYADEPVSVFCNNPYE